MTVDRENLVSSTWRGCQGGYRKPGVSDGGREERHNQPGELDWTEVSKKTKNN